MYTLCTFFVLIQPFLCLMMVYFLETFTSLEAFTVIVLTFTIDLIEQMVIYTGMFTVARRGYTVYLMMFLCCITEINCSSTAVLYIYWYISVILLKRLNYLKQ